ncbi:hypothetical protein M409DRAFT_69344 [Zasmidium cellare ATCC 36951]|uniref:Zn(2)-C6 fungal-type domain-containing protein n=1 Tax=Zasmidium cellare ATCC 36951 TaxID=1080233 RepID=A0A6A6C5D4_ZASCE|nr:uncharacterized protein M409DRAFT_69344 [Zasmidium cellare ATCC 36951]KAF2162133.1 hypothetical protein M409DRAFT_69344 [Zasmidium cellare ATCC 36951]
MSAKVTRRGGKKSRGGCSRCKQQHLKCDEQRPACGRCTRLGVTCPGYSQSLKWSTKHEVNTPTPGQDAQDDEDEQPSYTTIQQDSLPQAETAAFLDWSDPSFSLDQLATSDQQQDDFTAFVFPGPTFEAFSPSNQTSLDIDHLLSTAEHSATGMELSTTQRQPRRNNAQSMLRSLGARMPRSAYQVHRSLRDEPYELLSYYFKVVPQVYSMFDSERNPFRSAVSKSFGHSLAVNLAAQSMAASYLVEINPKFATIGAKLRQQALEAVQNEGGQDFHVILALMMSGPTGNWHQPRELGLTAYKALREHLEAMIGSGTIDDSYSFFQQAMVHWEMYLAYAADPEAIQPSQTLMLPAPYLASQQSAHPWTGVAPETSALVGSIGRLVRKNRLLCLNQQFVTQSHIQQMAQDLTTARALEAQLLACQHPDPEDVASTGDKSTPTWHLTAIADLHRYIGLLQLYRVFPDLLSDRLAQDSDVDALIAGSEPVPATQAQRNGWLTSFALEGLKLLESIPPESGTKDFQAFLLVALASELACETKPTSSMDIINQSSSLEDTLITKELDVNIMRKFVLDRLHALLGAIPPKPIRVCLDIVKETWRNIDNGQQNVYWLDVVIQNGWETILA